MNSVFWWRGVLAGWAETISFNSYPVLECSGLCIPLFPALIQSEPKGPWHCTKNIFSSARCTLWQGKSCLDKEVLNSPNSFSYISFYFSIENLVVQENDKNYNYSRSLRNFWSKNYTSQCIVLNNAFWASWCLKV